MKGNSKDICRSFDSLGRTVTSKDVYRTLDAIANVPAQFESRQLTPFIFPQDCDANMSERMEAINKLMQRLRKAGLAKFDKKKWTISDLQWQKIQEAMRLERVS